ncbi:hypothetical protein QA601_17580 [Chitinispirillales bacterium ANBcel5]|uniref:hypothetical protein n=1 Tax=Cellulosispirillum alkaliphilum TaxID=3039283 RepID=UPI002A4F3F1B|nr:hypothetical protein [Chitinispirillales bacterium ANBcel5]
MPGSAFAFWGLFHYTACIVLLILLSGIVVYDFVAGFGKIVAEALGAAIACAALSCSRMFLSQITVEF